MNSPHKYQPIHKFLLITGSLLLMAGMSACGGGSSQKSKAPAAAADSSSSGFRADTVQVMASPVITRDFIQHLNTTGTLNARQQATVRAKVSGQITHVYVDIGNHVHKGEMLLKIDPTDYKLALQQAEAQLEEAKAKLDNTKREKKRMTGLYKAGSATGQDKDQAVTNYKQAKASYQQALVSKNKAQQQLDYTSIRAPFNGVVTQRNFKVGDYASVAQPAVEVTDLSVLEAEMNIPERYAGSIETGLPVQLNFQSRIDSAQGKVTAVNPQINTDSRTFLVKVTVQNQDTKLPNGLFFTASFQLPELKNRLATPAGAIQDDQGQSIVWLVRNQKAHRRVVQTGPQNGNWVMIQQGLSAGDTVAVGGLGSLINGYPVKATIVDSLSSNVAKAAE